MTIIKLQDGKEIVLVEVPKGSSPIISDNKFLDTTWLEYPDKTGATFISLPNGNLTLLCTTDTITEDIAKGIVDEKKIKQSWDDIMTTVYTNYLSTKENLIGKYCGLAIEAFDTLKESNSLDPNKCYAILQNNK